MYKAVGDYHNDSNCQKKERDKEKIWKKEWNTERILRVIYDYEKERRKEREK